VQVAHCSQKMITAENMFPFVKMNSKIREIICQPLQNATFFNLMILKYKLGSHNAPEWIFDQYQEKILSG
jgi:hypothetical protein